jgi:hypothetical protein
MVEPPSYIGTNAQHTFEMNYAFANGKLVKGCYINNEWVTPIYSVIGTGNELQFHFEWETVYSAAKQPDIEIELYDSDGNSLYSTTFNNISSGTAYIITSTTMNTLTGTELGWFVIRYSDSDGITALRQATKFVGSWGNSSIPLTPYEAPDFDSTAGIGLKCLNIGSSAIINSAGPRITTGGVISNLVTQSAFPLYQLCSDQSGSRSSIDDVIFIDDAVQKVPGNNSNPIIPDGAYSWIRPESIKDDLSLQPFYQNDLDGPLAIFTGNFTDAGISLKITYHQYFIISSQTQSRSLITSHIDFDVWSCAMTMVSRLPTSMCNPKHETFIRQVVNFLKNNEDLIKGGAKTLMTLAPLLLAAI